MTEPHGIRGVFRIVYPSNARGETMPLPLLTGHFYRVDVEAPDEVGITPFVQTSDDTAVGLDPRACIFNLETHEVVYTPRMVPKQELAPWVRDWLRDHPRWGVPGCEQDWRNAAREGP